MMPCSADTIVNDVVISAADSQITMQGKLFIQAKFCIQPANGRIPVIIQPVIFVEVGLEIPGASLIGEFPPVSGKLSGGLILYNFAEGGIG